MEHLLCNRASEARNSLAIIDGDHRLTYSNLISAADILATKLAEKGLGIQEPVGILLGPGWQQVVSQVAVLRAAGSCTPIDPSVPDIQLRAMLSDLDVRFVLTTTDLSARVSQFEVLAIEQVLKSDQKLDVDGEISVKSGMPEDHRSHLLHTSGSSGKPKAVQVSSTAVIHVATSSPIEIKPGDRVGQLNNPGFDLSLFEIWVTLLSGGTVVHIPKSAIKDPVTLTAFLKDESITNVIFPTALFNIVATSTPSAFRSLRHVITAGESPNPKTMENVLSSEGPPENLWNGYGPTETTCFSTLRRVTLEDTQSGEISAGTPFGDTVLHLLDENQKPIFSQEVSGEICIGGPGLSAGYLNRPKENAEKFIRIDVPKSHASDQVETIPVYRTGDVGVWKGEPKSLFFLGRLDLQVKHQGFRVELEEVERTIAAQEKVKDVACLHEKSKDGAGSDRLEAFVVPESDSPIDPKDIIGNIRDQHPYYMVPDQAQVISQMPLNSRGKVDRAALDERHAESQQKESSRKVINGELGGVEMISEILEGILGISTPSPHENVFSLGLSSLQVARFLGSIKQKVGKPLSINDLYINPTIESLAQHLDQPEIVNYGPSEILQFEADSHLADDIELLPNWSSEGRVFLTGATGFIGINLLHRWLSMPSMQGIACLVRGNKHHSPLDRIQNTFKKYDLWNEGMEMKMKKIIILDGDITRDRLGLSQSDYQWLVGWAPAVFHAAAKVNWCEPYSSHFAPNVQGTRNVLRIAVEGRRKAFHYVSSIDVWAVTGLILGTKVVSEDGPLKVHLASLPFDTGYAQSQWVADEMVQRLRDRGLPVTIYRPGFVVGDSKTGAGNPDDFFSRMIVGCIQLGYWPHLPSQNMEYVTVDYVCDSILHISSDNRNIGHAYSLTATSPDLITNMERLCTLINQAGFTLEQVSYPDWLKKLETWSKLESSPLLSLMPLLAEPVLRDSTRLQTSKYSPVYECSNTLKAVKGRDDISFVQLTSGLVQSFIEFWIRKGFHSL